MADSSVGRRRRAFLTGRRVKQTPWQALCERLAQRFPDTFHPMGAGGAQARLRVTAPADAVLARTWCAEQGVTLGLWTGEASGSEAPVLWLAPHLASFQRLQGSEPHWFVQPGCPVGQLAQAGLTQLAALPPDLPVAVWLAQRRWHGWPPGQLWRAGLRGANVLLADGEAVTLGPFGVRAQRPLEGLRLQQLVPALFRLASDRMVAHAAEQPAWPARFRLDALLPDPAHDTNLAALLPGHAGALGWVQWVVLTPQALFEPPIPASPAPAWAPVDDAVRRLFDPEGRWVAIE